LRILIWKAIPVLSLYDIYCSGMCQFLTGFAVNLATCFILSQHVSQNCNVLIERTNIPLRTYHSSFVFSMSCFQISPKRLVMSTDILLALSCKLSYYCFLSYDKLWMFVSWNIWSMGYGVWNFMHGVTKHREFPLHFQSLKISPRKYCFLMSSMIRSTSTTFFRTISTSSWYSGQDRTLCTTSCGSSNAFFTRVYTEICTWQKKQLTLRK
jgi:hypothetical protein